MKIRLVLSEEEREGITHDDGELLSMLNVGLAMMAVLVVGEPPGSIKVVVVVIYGGA